jgi:AraC-like DNA-binding protein
VETGAKDQVTTSAEIFDVVHARILRFFPELVEELGGDLGKIAGSAGIPPAVLSDPSPTLTYRQFVQLLERAAVDLSCPDFGMQLARRQEGGGMFGPLGTVMRHSSTFGDALAYVRTHIYAHSLAARVWLEPLPLEEDMVFSGHDILLDRLPNRAQAVEQLMLAGHLAAMELTGGHVRVRRVHFRHQPVSRPRVYRRYFGCEVRFGEAADGVVFSRSDLLCPILDPDAGALAEITAFIDRHFTRQQPPLHAEVRGLIMRFLGTGDCSNISIALALNLHPRTLHRRLMAEGTSFQQIKDEVRRDIMLYYLQETDLDFTHVSEKLGFAEQSVMTRNCNRWLGLSPTQVRKAARG